MAFRRRRSTRRRARPQARWARTCFEFNCDGAVSDFLTAQCPDVCAGLVVFDPAEIVPQGATIISDELVIVDTVRLEYDWNVFTPAAPTAQAQWAWYNVIVKQDADLVSGDVGQNIGDFFTNAVDVLDIWIDCGNQVLGSFSLENASAVGLKTTRQVRVKRRVQSHEQLVWLRAGARRNGTWVSEGTGVNAPVSGIVSALWHYAKAR